MKVTGYAYPWDVCPDSTDPGFTDRALAAGVDEVAVAVAYHSARAATPFSTRGSAVTAAHAAFYRPVREEAWGPLRPATPDWVDSEDGAGEAVAALTAAGIPAAAWIVLTHSSRLGAAHPQTAVRNCYGETYPWALCPAQPRVRDYAATLTAESLRGLDVATVVLEACGQLGAVHQHQHEKTDGVWSPATARLLSVCCCTACAEQWTQAGADPAQVRATLRAHVGALMATGDLTTTDDELPAELAALLLETRQRGTDALRRAVLDHIPAGTRVALHGAVDPWTTGALPGLTPTAGAEVDAVVLHNWAPGPAGARAVAAARADLADNVAVGSYITAVAASAVEDIAAHTTDLAAAGATELHLYHLGLAGPARWPDITAATTAAHQAAPITDPRR
ncbi:hypothetical protein ACFPM7_15125 [Actinokineospora guangxiensis]|uniref:Alanine-rich protein n=1 Tax=Actinokineospora guangxiensis TaxID=1490288 RepID=A0ABW0ELU4_9PSEU